MKIKRAGRMVPTTAAQVGRALRRAAKDARRTARMHGVPIYVWEKGKIVALTAQRQDTRRSAQTVNRRTRECDQLRLGVPGKGIVHRDALPAAHASVSATFVRDRFVATGGGGRKISF